MTRSCATSIWQSDTVALPSKARRPGGLFCCVAFTSLRLRVRNAPIRGAGTGAAHIQVENAVKPEELNKLNAYFRKTFGNDMLEVRARPKKTDSCELYKADEFLGVIYKDEEDGDYNFSMAILDIDLD